MHTNWCVLIEISIEIGMLNFWLELLVTAQTKENYFRGTEGSISVALITAFLFMLEMETGGLLLKVAKSWKILYCKNK